MIDTVAKAEDSCVFMISHYKTPNYEDISGTLWSWKHRLSVALTLEEVTVYLTDPLMRIIYENHGDDVVNIYFDIPDERRKAMFLLKWKHNG